MPKETKQLRYEAKAQTESNKQRYIDELTALFLNSVKITGLDKEIPSTFILKRLLLDGKVGKYKGDFYRLVPSAVLDQYARPTHYNLLAGNGIVVASGVPREDIAIYRANKIEMPYYGFFEQVAEQLAIMDNSIKTNLINSQTSWLLLVEDAELANTIKQAYEDMAIGLPAIAAVKRAIGDAFADAKNISTDFVADRIKSLHRVTWDDALKRVGMMTSDAMKVERVSTAQTNAGVGESIDYIYAMIDTFNEDAETQEQPERMVFNGYVAQYDNPDGEQEKPENETEQEENNENEAQ